MMEEDDPDELNPSKLGTKQHWDDVYQTELNIFTECGDEGEVWFGEFSTKRIIKYVMSLEDVSKSDAIIDIGCGNGMLLVDLWECGYQNILGIDYSLNAIDLASSVAHSKGCRAKFEVQNILDWKGSQNSYKVALDKGTYDAISLDPDDSNAKREKYKLSIYQLLRNDGYFIITSCNWTEQEIVNFFATNLIHVITLPTPKIRFGGKSGNTVSAVVFKKMMYGFVYPTDLMNGLATSGLCLPLTPALLTFLAINIVT